MRKQEFLDKLRAALSGKVSSGLVMENMQFYEDYINTEIRKGKSEDEVLAALGDPRLIARTIIETKGGGNGPSEEYAQEDMSRGGVRNRERDGNRGGRMLAKVPAWVWLILSLLAVVLVLSAVFSVIAAVLPVVLPILLVLLLIKIFRDWVH